MLDALDLFHGETTDALAHIYARLPRIGLPEGCALSGALVGPDCRYARTLTTRVKFHDLGSGPTLLARAILPDPCGWTPELPFLYRATIELRCQGELLAGIERNYGIRRLGVRGKSFSWEGRRWVSRMIARECVSDADLDPWRATNTTMLVREAPPDLLHATSQAGVVVAAQLAGRAEQVYANLMRLARYPAVAMALVDSTEVSRARIREVAPNLICVQKIVPSQPSEVRDWAEATWWSSRHPQLSEMARSQTQPVIVSAESSKPDSPRSLTAVREEVDRLQRAVAPLGDFAGYAIV